jgi:hypothetical protein
VRRVRLLIVPFVCAMGLAAVASAQAAAADHAAELKATANPDLVGAVAKEIGSTPKQAEGATGALFGLAKSRLSAADFGKVSGAVPGMTGLLSAAPAVSDNGAAAALSKVAGTTGTKAAGLAAVAGSFSKLGLSPEMASRAVPVLTKYVTKSGGAEVGKLLAGVLK